MLAWHDPEWKKPPGYFIMPFFYCFQFYPYQPLLPLAMARVGENVAFKVIFCPQGSLTKKNDCKYLAVAPTFASGGFYANAVGFMSRQFPEGPADHKSVADVIETSASIWVVALASVRDAIKHEIVGGVVYTFQCRHECHPPSAFINFIAVSEPKHGAFIDEHPP